jgi:enoyl-CoA hydratase/carnithine racemase
VDTAGDRRSGLVPDQPAKPATPLGLRVEFDGPVATIILARPEARNALTVGMQIELGRIVRDLRDREDVRAVLIRGEGGAFCAGADAKGMGNDVDQPRPHNEEVWSLMERQRNLVGELSDLPQPTLAVLEGPSVGAGLSLALACDLRYAAPDAYLMSGFIRMGLPGDYGVTWLLTKLVGPSRAKDLLYFSDRIPMATAYQMGLVNEVVEPEQLLPRAYERAQRLAEAPLSAGRYLKQNVARAQSSTLRESMEAEALASIACTESPDFAAAIRSFLSRRRDS